jgi:hypothetical protein
MSVIHIYKFRKFRKAMLSGPKKLAGASRARFFIFGTASTSALLFECFTLVDEHQAQGLYSRKVVKVPWLLIVSVEPSK